MTPDDRVVLLKEMLPGLTEWIYQCLASDHPVTSANDETERTRRDALIDVMARLRFNDAKVQRVRNHCGVRGAEIFSSAYWSFKNRLNAAQVEDMVVGMQVLAQVSDTDEKGVAAAAAVVNELNESRGGKYEHMKFDPKRALLAIRCERYMKNNGLVSIRTDMDVAATELRNAVRRWERFPHQSIDEIFGRESRPRSMFPNVLFSDGKFGDGTEMVSRVDSNGQQIWVRSGGVESVVPEFEGLNSMQIQEAIAEKIAQAKKNEDANI